MSLDSYRENVARRSQRVRRAAPRPTFYFDLASPFTYLAAERVDRLFPAVEWRPALTEALHAGSPMAPARRRERAWGAVRPGRQPAGVLRRL